MSILKPLLKLLLSSANRGPSVLDLAKTWVFACFFLPVALWAQGMDSHQSANVSPTATANASSSAAVTSSTQPPQTVIGSVTFVIGKASLERSGQTLELMAGSELKVGDLLMTPQNGHVHVRFVDGALVSLRPSSSLKIQDYRFDPQNPASSQVRFELERGVVRAISGKAAESAKDKFRLNTPLAAIGVKGTDFVVEANTSRVNAIVNQGAIVLSPFDAQCSASGVGPCLTLVSKELTALAKGIAITYSASMPSPQLLPTGQLRGSELINLASPLSAAPSSLLSANASAASSNSATGNASAAEPASAGGVNINRVQQGQADAKTFAELNQILNSTAAPNSLIWGRWGSSAVQDNLTIPFLTAMQGRSVTVGDGTFFLFRTENNVPNLLSLGQGNVNFVLQGSQASFMDFASNTQAASVTGAQLGINFSTLNFNTTLNLSTPTATGVNTQVLQSTGQLNPNSGIFLSSTTSAAATQGNAPTVAGAVSLDTRQAGYVFTLPTSSGQFKGATLWGR
jgi:hypothetical protein